MTHHLLPNVEDPRNLMKMAAYMTLVHSRAQLSSLECRRLKLLKAELTDENSQLLNNVESNLLDLPDLMLIDSKTREISMFFEPKDEY